MEDTPQRGFQDSVWKLVIERQMLVFGMNLPVLVKNWIEGGLLGYS